MSIPRRSFYITLHSAGSIDIYPENHPSFFYNELENDILLESSHYEVGIVEVIFEGNLAREITREKQYIHHPIDRLKATPLEVNAYEIISDNPYIHHTIERLSGDPVVVSLPVPSSRSVEDKKKNSSVSDRDTHSCYIYTNLIESQLVGGQSLKLLRIIPVRNRYWFKFNKPHYARVANDSIRRILIDIRTVHGNRYNWGPGGIIIKLHFREINE